MIAGSNPNDDRSTTKYPTEYRVEWLRPPYIGHRHRPVIISLPSRANFDQSFDIKIKTPGIRALSRPNIKVVLMDLGFGKLLSSMSSITPFLFIWLHL